LGTEASSVGIGKGEGMVGMAEVVSVSLDHKTDSASAKTSKKGEFK
jgi:hypothetical protein